MHVLRSGLSGWRNTAVDTPPLPHTLTEHCAGTAERATFRSQEMGLRVLPADQSAVCSYPRKSRAMGREGNMQPLARRWFCLVPPDSSLSGEASRKRGMNITGACTSACRPQVASACPTSLRRSTSLTVPRRKPHSPADGSNVHRCRCRAVRWPGRWPMRHDACGGRLRRAARRSPLPPRL